MIESAVYEMVGSNHESNQDAWAISDTSMVLADGVGSWVDRGFDPSLWSHILVWEVSTSISDDPRGDMVESIRQGLARCRLVGSSTLVAISISEEGSATAYNIGDSAWFHVREGRIINRSSRGVHDNGVPRQLGRGVEGNLHGSDIPSDGDVERFDVLHDDLIVITSDGAINLLGTRLLIDTVDHEPAVAVEILNALVRDIVVMGEVAHDDITVIVARFRSPEGP